MLCNSIMPSSMNARSPIPLVTGLDSRALSAKSIMREFLIWNNGDGTQEFS